MLLSHDITVAKFDGHNRHYREAGKDLPKAATFHTAEMLDHFLEVCLCSIINGVSMNNLQSDEIC